ncbi:MAG: flavodoxin-dependent (E)-4-hydroxy-3-methylbut-2-enyl-diphosphate synthase, partial [Muribaculaceae bacterium]|nr:flavodoxin-dependent (E)-4-hydroxy-3-methylbut-2-enyl-diphosphate synthase [Muribaculaceae bacterium]
MTAEEVKIAASVDLGYLLLNTCCGNDIRISADALDEKAAAGLIRDILQATRRVISKTEYIACPGCGRTLFDLQDTLAKVKLATAGLKGLKIGVMGCIVNGPGEMADA